MEQQKISEYIDNISLKKSFGMGFRPDEVYEVICELTNKYNEVLAESYQENEELRSQLAERAPAPLPTAAAEAPVLSAREQFEALLKGLSAPPAEVPAPMPEPPAPAFVPAPAVEQTRPEKAPEPPAAPAPVAEERKRTAPSVELQKLKRTELLEILLDKTRQNEQLTLQTTAAEERAAQLQARLDDRIIKIEKAGTLAEATFLINGVVESAQAAAQQYLDNLQALYDREAANCTRKEAETAAVVDRMLADAKAQSEAMLLQTRQQCAALEEETRQKCSELEAMTNIRCSAREKQTQERCEELEAKAKQDAEQLWNQLSIRLEEFYKAHTGLRELLASTGQLPRG